MVAKNGNGNWKKIGTDGVEYLDDGSYVVIRFKKADLRPSQSGKTILQATTGKPKITDVKLGKPETNIFLSLTAFRYPTPKA